MFLQSKQIRVTKYFKFSVDWKNFNVKKFSNTVYVKSFEGENFHGSSLKLNM